jgi:hypothetical protein
MRCILAPCSGLSADALTQAADRTLRLDRQRATPLEPGSRLPPDGAYHELQLATAAPSRFLLTMPVAGDVVLLTQHLPSEFAMTLTTAVGREVHADVERAFAAEHTHDDAVGSVGFEFDAPFDQRKLNAAISTLLRERGADIFRMKGVLAVKDSDRRWVFQGVHMLLDAAPDEPWGDRTPKSQLIFIGRGLDRADLRARLEGALA